MLLDTSKPLEVSDDLRELLSDIQKAVRELAFEATVKGDYEAAKRTHLQDRKRIAETIWLEEYQSLWGKYSYEIEVYKLEILSKKDGKTAIFFDDQLVCEGDEPCEVLRCIPDVIKMLKEVCEETENADVRLPVPRLWDAV